jgi:tetratricopeptide (TPR) repeat protein
MIHNNARRQNFSDCGVAAIARPFGSFLILTTAANPLRWTPLHSKQIQSLRGKRYDVTAGRSRLVLALVAWLAFQAASAASQDTLAHAKDLYGSAAYDEALAILDRLQAGADGDTATEVALYRVFCLLVLERSDEAEKVIEGMVTADPFYLPADDQASPRIRSIFQDVRRSLLPGIVQRSYAEAKAAFNRKDREAAARFERVIALIDDPELRGVTALADLRTLASEFRDLSEAVASTAAAGSAARLESAVAFPAAQAAPATSVDQSDVPPLAREEDPGVSPPVTLSQPLPPWVPTGRDTAQTFAGVLEVVIDEYGDVTSATLREPVHPLYDAAVLRLALTWKYEPATRQGAPTAFLKIVRIRLHP